MVVEWMMAMVTHSTTTSAKLGAARVPVNLLPAGVKSMRITVTVNANGAQPPRVDQVVDSKKVINVPFHVAGLAYVDEVVDVVDAAAHNAWRRWVTCNGL